MSTRQYARLVDEWVTAIGLRPEDPVLYRQRHRIENLFARLKDWRRIHTHYDRCAHTFMSAIAFAAAFIFWINES